jgi:hypothetical protein
MSIESKPGVESVGVADSGRDVGDPKIAYIVLHDRPDDITCNGRLLIGLGAIMVKALTFWVPS